VLCVAECGQACCDHTCIQTPTRVHPTRLNTTTNHRQGWCAVHSQPTACNRLFHLLDCCQGLQGGERPPRFGYKAVDSIAHINNLTGSMLYMQSTFLDSTRCVGIPTAQQSSNTPSFTQPLTDTLSPATRHPRHHQLLIARLRRQPACKQRGGVILRSCQTAAAPPP
jgi:hypothetical protein